MKTAILRKSDNNLCAIEIAICYDIVEGQIKTFYNGRFPFMGEYPSLRSSKVDELLLMMDKFINE